MDFSYEKFVVETSFLVHLSPFLRINLFNNFGNNSFSNIFLAFFFMLCQSILICSNLVFVKVRILGSKLVAAVLSKREGAHEQAEHEVEHGQEGDGVVIGESLGQNQDHLENVLNPFDVLTSQVSSLGVINVSLAVSSFASKMSKESFYK